MSKFFIDTEFIEDFHTPLFGKRRHYIDLISIGIVSEDGRAYYAISNEFDVKAVWNKWQYRKGQGDRNNTDPREYWLRENVLRPIYEELVMREDKLGIKANSLGIASGRSCRWNLADFKYLVQRYGMSNESIAKSIEAFITTTHEYDAQKNMNRQPVSNAIFYSKPEFYGYFADYDWVLLCSLYGKMINLPDGWPMYCRDVKQMLDEFAEDFYLGPGEKTLAEKVAHVKSIVGFPKQINEHNALADAKWTKSLYEYIQLEK